MAQYIRFTKTTKKDVTVGKFYEVKNTEDSDGYYFDDDAGDQRYVRRRGKLNYFEVFNEADFPVSEVSDDELDDAVSAIEQVQEPEDETRYIVFSDTDKDDVTLGKPYVIVKDYIGGYVFYDDVDDIRYAAKQDVDNTFEIVGEDCESWLDAYERSVREAEEDDDTTGVVRIDFIDGEVTYHHDVDRFNVEDRGGITLVVIVDTEGGKTFVPFGNVRMIRAVRLYDSTDI